MQEDQEVTLDLREILKSFKKHLALIIICGLVAAIFGSVYTFFIASPVYTSSTQVVSTLPESDSTNTAQINGNLQMTNTINEVIVSRAILNQAQHNLGLKESITDKEVTATSSTGTMVSTIEVKNENPFTAQKIANEIATVFSEKAEGILGITNVKILSEAEVNREAVSPKPKIYIPLSLIIGLAIGAGIVLIMESFNNKITTEEQIDAVGYSVLGSIQYIDLDEFLDGVSENSKGRRSQVRNRVLEKMNVSVKSGTDLED